MNPEIIGVLIPVIAIVMGIGCGMLAIVVNYRKRKEMFALYHQERMAAIEKGIELPPLPEEFFAENGKVPSPHGRLLVGLVWLFIGLSWMIAFYLKPTRGMDGAAIYGLIPAMIGLAYLIYYFAVGKKEAEALEAERKAKTLAKNRPPTT
jgi:hypothetical protein